MILEKMREGERENAVEISLCWQRIWDWGQDWAHIGVWTRGELWECKQIACKLDNWLNDKLFIPGNNIAYCGLWRFSTSGREVVYMRIKGWHTNQQ